MVRIGLMVMLVISCLFAVMAFASQAPPSEAMVMLVVDLPVMVESISLGGLSKSETLDTGQIVIICSTNDLPLLQTHDTKHKRLTMEKVRSAIASGDSWFANIGFHSSSDVC